MPAERKGEVSIHAGYYADDNHVRVWNPSLRARVPLSQRISATASYGLDMVSAASVDVVTSASKMVEYRHETTVGVDIATDSRNVFRTVLRDSRESDYVSDGLSLSVDHDTDRRDRTVHFELHGRRDLVGPGWVLARPATLVSAVGACSVTQVIDPLTVARVALQTEVFHGFQSSVYRYVPIGGGAYPEQVPEGRLRGAALARIEHSLVPTLAISLEYVFGTDTWGVWSHSGDLGLRWEITPWALLEARHRIARQSPASFYRSHYDQLVTYRTRDRLLSGLTSWWPQVSFRVSLPPWPAPADWELGLAGGYLYQHFDDYPLLSRRSAILFEAWIGRRF